MSKPPPLSALSFPALTPSSLTPSSLTPATTNTGSETDDHDPSLPGVLTRQPSQDGNEKQDGFPTLSHRLRHSSSILAVVVGEEEIYAGTQGGEILVYSLNT